MNLGKKISGGRYHSSHKTKKHERKGTPRIVKLKETKKVVIRGLGGSRKTVLLSCNSANVIGKDGKSKKAKIVNVVETKANKFWARENRMIKGAIIDTELGKARITNRPSQEGCINAVLVD